MSRWQYERRTPHRARRWVAAPAAVIAGLLLGATAAAPAHATPHAVPTSGASTASAATPPPIPKAPIGISNVVVRLEGRDEIGLAGADFRIHLIERLRERGFAAVGAESLVFDKDESQRAAFKLGGIVRELDCRTVRGFSCRVGIEWQLLDVARDAVVYTVFSRAIVRDLTPSEAPRMASRLLLEALDQLLVRDAFRRMLATSDTEVERSRTSFPIAAFARCAPLGKPMPGAAEDVLRATVVVRGRSGFGSGFFFSSDGLVMTAAHVVDAPLLTLRLRDGTQLEAVPVRVNVGADVAVLRVTRALPAAPCLAASAKESTAIGAELYAVGAPAHLELAFSLTRGIVSAVREIEGRRVLQTDAPVSPGNSGGPFVDATGAVAAITSFKLAARAVEGVGFGVPFSDALEALGLTPGASTDAALTTAKGTEPTAAAPRAALWTDVADPFPSFDPEGDRRRAEEDDRARRARDEAAADIERRAARDRATPGAVKALRWGGLTVGAAGAATVLLTYASYVDATKTRAEFETLRLYNTLGWAALGVGAGAFASYFILRPPLGEAPPPSRASRVTFGPGSVRWEGSF
jgi:S1-C subfamily serine protease